MATAVTDPTTTPTQGTKAAPILVDLGKKSRKQIRQMREGNGKLMEDVTAVLDELRSSGSLAATAQPVLIVVRQKPRKRAGMKTLLPRL